MLVSTHSYTSAGGWSSPLPSDLDGPGTLVVTFGASDFVDDPTPFTQISAAFPKSVHAGCSTAGEILGACVHDASISVAVAQFAHTTLHAATATLTSSAESAAAGAALASQLPPTGLRAVLLLSDGLNANGTALVNGLVAHLPEGVHVVGGLAGDGSRFQKTWVFDGSTPAPGKVRAVGLYGERLAVGLGCDGGWSDFGPERLVTRSEGNVLYELDNKPALDLYKQYLGELVDGLPGSALLFPLSIRRAGTGDSIVRTVLAVDEEQKSLTFAGDIPEGAVARLMRSNNEALIGSAERAGEQASGGLNALSSSLLISISCVGRRLLLGERSDEEVEAVLDSATKGVGHVGFYSYGEISPVLLGGSSELHNQTMTVTAFAEV